jgi:hypothetical protein
MLANGSYHVSERSGRSEKIDARLSEVREILRRLWSALKERLAPNEPALVPVPVRVRRDR